MPCFAGSRSLQAMLKCTSLLTLATLRCCRRHLALQQDDPTTVWELVEGGVSAAEIAGMRSPWRPGSIYGGGVLGAVAHFGQVKTLDVRRFSARKPSCLTRSC